MDLVARAPVRLTSIRAVDPSAGRDRVRFSARRGTSIRLCAANMSETFRADSVDLAALQMKTTRLKVETNAQVSHNQLDSQTCCQYLGRGRLLMLSGPS